MALQSVRDLFEYELGAALDMERTILEIMPQMAGEIGDPHVQAAFQHHEQETQQQARNLEQCFQILGTQPVSVRCDVIHAVQQEHDSFARQIPSPDILAMFDFGSSLKVETYESATYQGLIEKANLLALPDCARLLQENLRQEEEQARHVQQVGMQFARQILSQSGAQSRRATA
jgi:ferritin-like metal-binding protein YciE